MLRCRSIATLFTARVNGTTKVRPKGGGLPNEGQPIVTTLSPDSHHLISSHPLAGVHLGTVEYGIPLAPGFRPAVVVELGPSVNVLKTVEKFTADAEFDSQFLEVVVFVTETRNKATNDLVKNAWPSLKSRGCKSVFILTGGRVRPPEGPWFVREQSLHQTWRLYPDIYQAFQLPTIHDANLDEFRGVTIMIDGQLMVPVPSRLHYQKTRDKPLSGVRATVKDIMHLKGVKTTGQSRAYEKLYGPQRETASIITKLIDLGVVIIGKTKCTQFASSDQPTADWVEYFCPMNPRGDLYLSPRGSSTGTCVAVAGYDWCDIGIGSDTGGSIRGPAAVMGLFALRPTHSFQNLRGIIELSGDMDTPGIVCREAHLFHQVSTRLFGRQSCNAVGTETLVAESYTKSRANQESHVSNYRSYKDWRHSLFKFYPRELFDTSQSSPAPSQSTCPQSPVANAVPVASDVKPTVLLYPLDYWDQWSGKPVTDKMEEAVRQLEQYLGVKRKTVNLEEKWLEGNPAKTQEPLKTYLQDTFMTLLWKGYYGNFSDFRKEYKEKYGSPPYVHPVIQECWKQGEKISQEQLQKAKERKEAYRSWLRNTVLGGESNAGEFNTIMVYPVGDFAPFYRDVYRKDPRDQIHSYDWTEREDHQASLAGVPAVVLSVGQVAHPSKVTGKQQELPVSISLMSGAGTDTQLTGLLVDITKQGFLKGEVKVGTHAF